MEKTYVQIAPYDGLGRILLQERHGIANFGEHYSFFGGEAEIVAWGSEGLERPIDTAIRELWEELTYRARRNEMDWVGHFQHVLPDGVEAKRHLYAMRITHPGIFKQREGQGMGLFTVPEARNLRLQPGDYKLIGMLYRKPFYRQIIEAVA